MEKSSHTQKGVSTGERSNQSETDKSSFYCWSGNKGLREKLQSKEKTLLGNGKIKTEVDM